MQHRNDTYGEVRRTADAGDDPPIPASTVVLLRDRVTDGKPETQVLMLRKNAKITFGGMWVFPGGRIDDDELAGGTLEEAARQAAVREAEEEAALKLDPQHLLWIAHWTPPPGPAKRFAAWFFAAPLQEETNITVDQGEIEDHVWIAPGAALARHAAGEIDLAPPTWVTLHQLALESTVAATLERLQRSAPRTYETHVAKQASGERVAMWAGDAGYDDWNADATGPRHRLVMAQDGFRFEADAVSY